MTEFTCMHCLRDDRDVRLVEHGTDHMPLCKMCFASIKAEFDNRMEDNE